MKIQSYRDLEVWPQSIVLADAVYDLTQSFPKEEMYGLSSQMRRAAVSVASNIAEGSARNGTRELIHFLNIARGSLAELETQLVIAHRRKLCSTESYEHATGLAERVHRMLLKLMQALRTKIKNNTIHDPRSTIHEELV